MKREDLEKIGKVLREKREEKGLSIEHVSNVLKINPTYLISIENGETDKFPAEIFLKGFLRNYASFLNLDYTEYIDINKKETRIGESELKTTPQNVKRKININTGYVFVVGVLILIFFSWARVEYVNRKTKTDYERRQESGFKTLTTAKEIALHEQKKKLMQIKEGKDNITVRAKEDCWIEIKDGDTKIFQGLLIGGEEREFTYKSGLKIKLGNAGVVEIDVRGKKMAGLGNKGEVREIVID
ncbi:MAG: DUF4115 domain-containing protein [Proteobacteria bacterium]|nr:DUF4115 domain-containing protein [Pseudomonadota bacterium]